MSIPQTIKKFEPALAPRNMQSNDGQIQFYKNVGKDIPQPVQTPINSKIKNKQILQKNVFFGENYIHSSLN